MVRRTKMSGVLLIIGLMLQQAFGQQSPIQNVDLKKGSNWRFEFEYPEKSRLYFEDSTMVVESFGGATIWLDSLLQDDYVIEYERMVVVDSGVYDRLSDLNQFWLAHESGDDSLLSTRDGKLASYDGLDLFYVGMGGNYNSTTRFRKYDGRGERVLLEEKNDQPYLLNPNVYYKIKTVVSPRAGFTSFYVNDTLIFTYRGVIGKKGFFGFRQTLTRQKIKNALIYPLSD